MSKPVFWSLFALALVLGLALRLPQLDARPMHHDEANQAVKFGALLETGQYRYDPTDHHGPTLYYLTLPAAWLRGQTTLAALDERTLRLVPVFFGAATLLMLAWLARGLGHGAVVGAAALAAISPALTYYSRFYIQETLFVFFAFGFVVAVGRYAVERRPGWAIGAGAFAGLAFATKETAVVVVPAALIACAGARRLASVRRSHAEVPHTRPAAQSTTSPDTGPSMRAARDLVLGALVAVIVAAALYSSFGSNPGGIVTSVRAFGSYAGRGLQPSAHIEPWYYYLRLLAWSADGGLVWTEGLVLLLALVGMVSAFGLHSTPHSAPGTLHRTPHPAQHPAPRTQHGTQHPAPGTQHPFWPRYLTLYSLLTCIAYSAIPYKTPWNLLPFYVGLVVMAGFGVSTLMQSTARTVTGATRSWPAHVLRAASAVVLFAAGFHLARQDWRATFRYAADPRNPYAYVQTSPDFLRLVKRVQDLTALHGDGPGMLVKVVAGPYEQWPLPWYLRRMTRVGYWTTASSAAPLDTAPVLIASSENAPALDAALGERYQQEYYGLRPDVLLAVYIERGLWEEFLRNSELRIQNLESSPRE